MRPFLCILVLLLTVGRAFGDWDGMVSLVERLSDGSDLVLVVDDAASIRATPVGHAIGGMLDESGLVFETFDAWRELAGLLKLTDEAAFDRLLGRRVTYVASGLGSGAPAWALLLEVDTKTRSLLRSRMKPVPRYRVNGRPVYALEHGRFVLASVATGRDANPGSSILLAPSGNAELFERLLDRLADGGAPRADDGAVGALRTLEPGTALVLWRTKTGLGERLWDEPRYLAASITVDGASIAAHTRGSSGLLWGPDDCCGGYPLWPGEQADKLAADALFVDIGLLGGSGDDLFGSLHELVTEGWFADAYDGLSPFLGQRAAVVIRKHSIGQGPPSLAMELAVEMDDLQRASRAGDQALSRAATRFSSPHGQAEPAREMMVEFPGALRSASLGSWGNGLFGSAPAAAWTYPVDPLGESLGAMGDPQGWLALRVGESGTNLTGVRQMRDLLGGAFDPDSDPRVSQGMVRPAALLDVVAQHGLVLPPPLSLAERLERVEWTASLDGDEVVGTVGVRIGLDRDDR